MTGYRSRRQATQPLVMVATGYPLHGDAVRTYLHGFYQVSVITPMLWRDGLAEVGRSLQAQQPVAFIMDNTFPYAPLGVARQVKSRQPGCGLIYVDAAPNIFRVLHCLEVGFSAYLYLGDSLSEHLRQVVDMAHRSERYLSPTIADMHRHYQSYKGLFTGLPPALLSIFRLMGEGLSVSEIEERTGLATTVIYRRQYRLRMHFGVDTNAELVGLLRPFSQEVS